MSTYLSVTEMRRQTWEDYVKYSRLAEDTLNRGFDSRDEAQAQVYARLADAAATIVAAWIRT